MTSSQDEVGTPEAAGLAATRSRLLDAATEVFLENGPAFTTLEAIAKRAGVAEAALTVHFADQVELMSALAGRLYLHGFPFSKDPLNPSDLRAFLQEYLDIQQRPDIRLIWKLGDLIAYERPGGLDAAYWHVVGEIEIRMVRAACDEAAAHRWSLVLTPALMLVARRAAFDLVTSEEVGDFVDAACLLALGPDSKDS